MLIKLREMMTRKEGQKGFTLIELIIVMAILAILAAIALPRYRAIQGVSRVRADAATAQSICAAARLQETNDGIAVSSYTNDTTVAGHFDTDYFDATTLPQSGGTGFAIDKTGGNYRVRWTPDATLAPGHAVQQDVIEGQVFTIKP